jgi:uncharacterized protein (DUF488 family)
MSEKVVFSMGHSTRDFKDFVFLLKKYYIKNAVDIRRYPFSRKFPHFNRDFLEDNLKRNGINYLWLGELLGGRRKSGKGKLWSGYLKHMQTEDFKKGIEKIEELIKKGNTVFFCAEKLFFKCHRKFIARKFIEKGYSVIDIVDDKRELKIK